MDSVDYRFFIENDNSPFIVFDNQGKIVYLNATAELLLGKVDKSELYGLCINFAPKNYGSKTTHIDLKYGDLFFYAVTVGYKDDEMIGIRFYQKIKTRNLHPKELSKFVPTDINAILETAISILNVKKTHEVKLITDFDIPEFKLSQNDFLKIVRKGFESFNHGQTLNIEMRFKIGESIRIKDERCRLIQLQITSQSRSINKDIEIMQLCESLHIDYIANQETIKFVIPMITS